MRTVMVVVMLPMFQLPASIGQTKEDLQVQALVAQLPVPAYRLPLRQALPLHPLLALLGTHNQALFGVQPIDPLRVYFPALALQQHRQFVTFLSGAGQDRKTLVYAESISGDQVDSARVTSLNHLRTSGTGLACSTV